MTFDDYDTQANRTAIYQDALSGLLLPIYLHLHETEADPEVFEALDKADALLELFYLTVGLVGEAGEVANKVKKVLRDGLNPKGITGEIGDTLWYLSQLGQTLNLPLSRIAQDHLDTLADRKNRDMIKGSGDNR